MEKKITSQAFVRILKEHGIKSLYHFTDRKNLESIIKYGGLYSWMDCVEQGITIPKPGGDIQSRELDARKGLEYTQTGFLRISSIRDSQNTHEDPRLPFQYHLIACFS